MKTWSVSLGSSIGSGLTALCCLGIPALIGFLSTVGLGFLVHDGALVPLLVFFLGLNFWAIHISSKRHQRKAALYLAMASAILVISGLWFSTLVVSIGIIGVFTTSALDIYFSKACRLGCQQSHSLTERR